MLGIPHEDRKDNQPGQHRRDIRRRMAKPAALGRRDHEEREKPERRERADIFRQASQAEAKPGEEPEAPDAALVRAGIEKEPRKRPRRQGEPEQERSVRHDPRPGGSEEEGRGVEPEQRDESGSRTEQLRRQPIEEPARRSEQRDERQPRGEPFAGSEPGKMSDPLMERRMIEIRKAEVARDGKRVGFVDAETERKGEGEPRGEKDKHDCRRAPVCEVERRRFVPRRPQGAEASVATRYQSAPAAGIRVGADAAGPRAVKSSAPPLAAPSEGRHNQSQKPNLTAKPTRARSILAGKSSKDIGRTT